MITNGEHIKVAAKVIAGILFLWWYVTVQSIQGKHLKIILIFLLFLRSYVTFALH
jgi:hypothetical protein